MLNSQYIYLASWQIGGEKCGTKHIYAHTSDIYVLNEITHHWDVGEQIPSPRVAPLVINMADTIIIIGGVGDDGQLTNTVWIGSCDP